jgi:hypothetical protein
VEAFGDVAAEERTRVAQGLQALAG